MSERETWLAERKTGLGSSDAAAACGLSRWATPLAIYLDKTGQLPEQEPTPAMQWGLRLEPVLAAAYLDHRPGVRVYQPRLRRHSELPWMFATVDRLSDDNRIVELKTASRFAADDWGEPGTDQIPLGYLVQVSHQMAVYRSHGDQISAADVAVLVGGTDFRVYTVPWVEAVAVRLIEVEAALWDRIVRRDPPPPDWQHSTTPELIAAMYAPEGGTIVLDAEALELARHYSRLGEEEHDRKESRAVLKAKLIERMGVAALGLLPDGSKIFRRRVHRKGYEVQPADYTTFTIKQAEEP